MRKNLFFLFLWIGTIEYFLIRFVLTTPMLDQEGKNMHELKNNILIQINSMLSENGFIDIDDPEDWLFEIIKKSI